MAARKRTLHKLTATEVRNLKAHGRHSDGGGLYLNIDDRGRRWVFIYRDRGTRRLREMGLAWMDERDGLRSRKAAVLHRDDPRHAERTAAAKVKAIKAALKYGGMVLQDDALRRIGSEVTAVRAGIQGLTSRLHLVGGETADEVQEAVAADVETILAAHLTLDDAAQWPVDRMAAIAGENSEEPAEDDDGAWLEGGEPEEVETLPRWTPGDPRFDFALASARAREAELEALYDSVIDVPSVLELTRESNTRIRDRLRTIAFDVGMALQDGPNDFAAVEDAVRSAAFAALTALVEHHKARAEAA